MCVVEHAAEARFVRGEQIVNKGAVGTCSGHDGEVADVVGVF